MTDFPLDGAEIDEFLARAFAEDVGGGDVTVAATVPPGARLTAAMNAREPLVLAGLPLAVAAFQKRDPAVQIAERFRDGDRVEAGATLLTVSGLAGPLLTAERTALNTLQHLSGIATLTRHYAEAIAGTGAVLLDTRKTLPGWRRLQKYAVRCGGGANHRMGLYDAILIKDNHIALAGSLAACIDAARAAGHRDIEVECDTLDQAEEAVAAGATRLLLDNMSVALLREAVARFGGRVPLEASGSVRLETIRAIAETGVDFISVGRLTQSAVAVDIGLDFTHRE